MKPDEWIVFPTPFVPGIVTRCFDDSWAFYTEVLGFQTIEERTGYVRLLHPCGAQLNLLAAERGDTPSELVCPTDARGWWLTLDVADVDCERDRMDRAGALFADLPVAARWVGKAFAIKDPNGVLILLRMRPSLVRKVEKLRENELPPCAREDSFAKCLE